MASSGNIGSYAPQSPHVALLPSAGMGHLTPFLRFAESLISHHCRVTLITTYPIVSQAESRFISTFLAAFPQVQEQRFHLLPFDPTTANSTDPFTLKWESIRRSSPLLSSILSSLSPPLSALVSDVSLISSVIPVTEALRLPNYILFVSAARMFSFFAYYPTLLSKMGTDGFDSCDILQVPGGEPIPKSSIPPLLLDKNSLFSSIFTQDGDKLGKLDGILINTLETLEPDSLNDLRGGKVAQGLPQVFTIGLKPCHFERSASVMITSSLMKWLDDQLPATVVFFCFGSRTAIPRDQIREIGKGLLMSGHPFLWVVKDKILDKDDAEGLDAVLGYELWERLKEKGMVVKEWICQEEILGHKAVGGFVSHSGWGSITEALWHGVPILAWPVSGDQKINTEVVDKRGFGLWPKTWGWAGETMVKGEEVGSRIKELMGSEIVKQKAAEFKEQARQSIGDGGCCETALNKLIEQWKNGRSDKYVNL